MGVTVSEEMAIAQITGALCEPAMQWIEMLCFCLTCETICSRAAQRAWCLCGTWLKLHSTQSASGGMLNVKALELLSMICKGCFGLRDEPKPVTTRPTSGNCVGWPSCWHAPRYIVEPLEKVRMGVWLLVWWMRSACECIVSVPSFGSRSGMWSPVVWVS